MTNEQAVKLILKEKPVSKAPAKKAPAKKAAKKPSVAEDE